MIGKVLRGERPAGLIYYLYGPGKHEEHTDPHIVAGWRHPAELEPPLRPGGHRDFRQLNGLLQQTIAALGTRAPARPVWHCIARTAPGDQMLSDDEWAHVAGEIMHRTGLAPRGEEDDAVHPGEITGYSVALAGDMTSAGEPVWYGGGKLAADLTLPKLRRRWNDAPDGSAARNARLTPAERAAIWDHAARTATNATAQVRQLARSSRGSSPAPAQQGGPNSAPANWS